MDSHEMNQEQSHCLMFAGKVLSGETGMPFTYDSTDGCPGEGFWSYTSEQAIGGVIVRDRMEVSVADLEEKILEAWQLFMQGRWLRGSMAYAGREAMDPASEEEVFSLLEAVRIFADGSCVVRFSGGVEVNV